MVPRKGMDNGICGLARLVHRYGIPARMLIVGGDTADPDERVTSEARRLSLVAAEEGVADRVEMVGHRGREALKYYYSAADVVVTTPWYEPFGITPVEAMACGTPVVGSNVGGIRFTVRDGETGYLVPPNDPDALVERLAQLFCNQKLMSSSPARPSAAPMTCSPGKGDGRRGLPPSGGDERRRRLVAPGRR